MRENYMIVARKMRSTALGTIALADSARMPTGNPNFMPRSNNASSEVARIQQERDAKDAITSVPFFIRMNEENDTSEVSTYGRPGVTATSMKGTIRHVAARLTTRGLNNLSLNAATLLFSGGLQEKKGTEKEPNPSDIAHADRGIALLGVFGSWTDGIGAKGGNFGNAYSKGHFTLQRTGIVRQPHGQQERDDLVILSEHAGGELARKLGSDSASSATMGKAKKAVTAANKALKAAKVTNDAAAIEIAQSAVKEANANFDEADTGRGVSTGQLHGKWNIPVGVDFDFTFNHAMTKAEVGLLIESFRVWMRRDRGVLGGDKGRGAGFMFDCEFAVMEYRDGAYHEIGTICTDAAADQGKKVLDAFVSEFEKSLPETQKTLASL